MYEIILITHVKVMKLLYIFLIKLKQINFQSHLFILLILY